MENPALKPVFLTDIHAKTHSLPNLPYENCIKCGNSDFIIKDINWSSQDGSCSRMGKWCTRCNITYYDYAVITGLRCCLPVSDGNDCCSFLSADFECTRPERHVQDAKFQVLDFNYAQAKRIAIYVSCDKKINVETNDGPDAIYFAKEIDNFFAFSSAIRNLRQAWNFYHRKNTVNKTEEGG